MTKDNLNDVLALTVREDQQHLVAPNARSIAQGCYAEEAWYRAIYADETPVGFVMLYTDNEEAQYGIWRFMIDAAHQGKGYGRQAMELVLEHVRSLPNATELKLSFVPAENNPQPFYAKFGFEETGEKLGNELVMVLTLT